MSAQPDNRHYVRRVVLPSGKTIEVVYFEDDTTTAPTAATAATAPVTDATVGDLHICGGCSSELVYPTDWEAAGTRHWEISLRCPNCEWAGTGVFEQELVDRFDEELSRGSEAIVRDLKRLSRANMEEAIERFSAGLQQDCILPEDF